ncbi:hypothetical protein QFC22_002247 [Naganishia vaughanmartiniae]|uniref:Uncharacterized protein n=1 Tax=Naganishia vaughanmartiniae TaxID=1424756 RepID=A0ACC2XCH2_9TREE|nr:hypothetical protein QFC22_002247 [Naganishia vaughanmartiniae]
MSFTAQETDPLLANPNRPSKTQNVPRAVDPADGQAHIDASSELDSDDEAMGTWGTRDERSKWRQRLDYFALGCILFGALLFVGVVWYIVCDTQMKQGGLGPFVWHPTSQSLGIAFAVLSIQSLQSTTSPSGSRLKEKAWKQHQVLLVAFAFPLFALGSSAIIYNKALHHGAHFQSVLQAFAGGLAHHFAPTYGLKATRFYSVHRVSGYLLIPLIAVTALSASYTDWVKTHSELGIRVIGFDVGLALVALGVVLRIRRDISIGKLNVWNAWKSSTSKGNEINEPRQ